MSTVKKYLASRDLSGTAKITFIADDRRSIRLDETLFHAQGGGQRADCGVIGKDHVVSVKHAEDGEVDHFLEQPTSLNVGDEVAIQVDEAVRDVNMKYHSAGHLLADVVEALEPSLRAVQGHHWPGEARVEFEGATVETPLSLDTVQAATNLLIEQDEPMKIVGDPFATRALQIGQNKAVGCGGTHVTSTGLLAGLTLEKIKLKKGRLRISYRI